MAVIGCKPSSIRHNTTIRKVLTKRGGSKNLGKPFFQIDLLTHTLFFFSPREL